MMKSIFSIIEKIRKQEKEDEELLHLTAFENQMSKFALSLLSSKLSYRYYLGHLKEHGCTDPSATGEFLFKGFTHIYELEKQAIEATRKMFDAQDSDLRPTSGMQAMISTLATFSNPGDNIYSVDNANGGHFATQYVSTLLGRNPITMPVDVDDLSVDLQAFAKQVKQRPAHMVYLDIGCPLFPLPVQKIRDIVGPKTIIVYDASHTQGLIAGGLFQKPLLEGADILQGNTHKTFPGPQKAMIHFKDLDHAEKMKSALSNGLVSSQHTHHSLALFFTIFEMLEFGKSYAKQIIVNAQALAKYLEEEGVSLIRRKDGQSTQSNVLLIKSEPPKGHVESCTDLFRANIATNSRRAFGKKPVIRIGVQEVTRRGMKEKEMKIIAQFLGKIIVKKISPGKVKNDVIDFNKQFQDIEYSFDKIIYEKK